DGAELVHVYAVQDRDETRPLRALKAFEKVQVAQGQEATFRIRIPQDVDSYWDVETAGWKTGPIALCVCVGDVEHWLPWPP
ncbi:MAG: fibronectin type III-like domain-contianing protein, partial [Planctomycetes bacterium]|nr:fibronectin type III-like domain-contianing protein [Planctomycetota bacterium]